MDAIERSLLGPAAFLGRPLAGTGGAINTVRKQQLLFPKTSRPAPPRLTLNAYVDTTQSPTLPDRRLVTDSQACPGTPYELVNRRPGALPLPAC